MKVGFSTDGPDHGARHVRDLQQRSVRRPGRRADVGPHGVAPVSAAGHALARRDGADEHAAAQRAELARRPAGHHDHRADHREGRARARARPGRDSTRQLSGGQGGVRTGRAGQAAACHQRIPQGGARPRRGAVQMAGASDAHAEADRVEGARRRRVAQLLRRRHDRASTGCSSSSPTAGSPCTPESAISEPSR